MISTTQWIVFSFFVLALSWTQDSFGSPSLEKPFMLDSSSTDKVSLFEFHKNLVNIESTSGREHTLGLYLESFLKGRNFTTERQLVDPLEKTSPSPTQRQRFNLLAYHGVSRQTPLLVTTHIDTVPPHIPYSRRSHNSFWGRGTVDAKACIATQIQAYQELLVNGEVSVGQVSFLFVVGEEIGGDGMIRANDLGLSWDAVVFGEPTDLKLASGHKGILIFTITAHGKSGHSGYPNSGENANMMLIPALAALQRAQLPKSEKYGYSTVNIGMIDGGVAANVIAERSQAAVGIRLAAGTAEVAKKIVLDTIKKTDERLEVVFHGGSYGPVNVDSDIEGFESKTVNYGTDIPNLRGKHKRYLYGPGSILQAHSDHEHIESSDLLKAVEGYKHIIRTLLKNK